MELLWIVFGIVLVWLIAMYYNAGWMSKWMVSKQLSATATSSLSSTTNTQQHQQQQQQNALACDCFENLSMHVSSKAHLERLLIETCFGRNTAAIDVTLERVYAVNKHIAEGINTSTNTNTGYDSLPYINGISKCISEYVSDINNQEKMDRILVRWKANEVSITTSMESILSAKDVDRVLAQYRTSTIQQITAHQQQNYTSSFLAFDSAVQAMQELYTLINTSISTVNK